MKNSGDSWKHCPGSPNGAHHQVIDGGTGIATCRYCDLQLKYELYGLDEERDKKPEVLQMPANLKRKRGRPPKRKPEEQGFKVKTESGAAPREEPVAEKPKHPRPPAAEYDMETRLAIAEEAKRRGEHGVRDLVRESEGGYVDVDGVGRIEVKKLVESTIRGWVRKIEYFKIVLKLGPERPVSSWEVLKERNTALDQQMRELIEELEKLKAENKRIKSKVDRLGEYDLAFVLEGVDLLVAEKGVCKMRFHLGDPEMRAVARRTCSDFVETYINNLRPAVPRVEVEVGV